MAVTPEQPEPLVGQPDDGRDEIADADVAFVRSVLASAGTVGPIPEDVGRRVEAALAVAASDSDSDRRSVVPRATRRARRRVATGPALLVAASVVGVLTLGGLALTARDLTADQSVAGGSDGGAAESSAGDTAAGAAEAGPGATGVPPVLASGRDYTPTDLPAQVQELVRGGSSAAALSAPTEDEETSEAAVGSPLTAPLFAGRDAAPSLSPLQDPAGLQACIQELAAGDSALSQVTVDLATFAGEPAAVVVLGRAGEDRVDAWVVGGGCSPGDAQVRYFSSVALG